MLFYSRNMGIMLLTGVHLQEALALAEEMFPKLLRKRIAPVREAVDSGKSLCDAYAMVPVFSPMFFENGCSRRIKWTPSFKFCANRLTQSGSTEKYIGLGQYAD